MSNNLPLRTVLKHIPVMHERKVTFSETLDDRIVNVETPVYVAPAKYVNNTFHLGIYRPKLGLQYVPFGLYKVRDFITSAYDFNGTWKQGAKMK